MTAICAQLPSSMPAQDIPLPKALAMTSAMAAIPRSASFQSARRTRAALCRRGQPERPMTYAPKDREQKGASDALPVAPTAREGRSELGPRRCAARHRSSSHAFVRPCESCHGELGCGNCLGQSFRRELVTRRSIAVRSVLRRGNWNPALAVLNKHLAIAH